MASKGRGKAAQKGKSYEKARAGKGASPEEHFELKPSKVPLGEESRDEILALIAQLRRSTGEKKPVSEAERDSASSEEEESGVSNRQKRKEQIRLKKSLMKQLLEEDKREARATGEAEDANGKSKGSKPDSSHVQVRVFYRDERKPSEKNKGPELIRRGSADALEEFLEMARKKLQINGKRRLWVYKKGDKSDVQQALERTSDLADGSVLVVSMRDIPSSATAPPDGIEKAADSATSQADASPTSGGAEETAALSSLEAVRAAYAKRAVQGWAPLTDAEKATLSLRLQRAAQEYEGKDSEIRRSREALPVAEARAAFLEALQAHQVVIVAGETGSGKTTQCPNFILEAAAASGKGGEISIICTQPRRIAAVGVATRVAEERGEPVGDVVGFAVRLNAMATRLTRLLFCTSGVLLTRLNASPDLDGVTHIILDEVHERSLHTDFLLTILRELLRRKPDLKLVLMSATLQQKIFLEYFSSFFSSAREVPVINVSGRTHPVTVRYEGQAQAASRGGTLALAAAEDEPETREEEDFDAQIRRQYGRGAKEIRISPVVRSSADYRQIARLCAAILGGNYEPDGEDPWQGGAILIFLPGHAEIENCISHLRGQAGVGERAWILPLHGSMSVQQQQRVFKRPPAGQRKIIVSTNIAETSITIDDVTHVIDSCHVKETRFSPQSSTSVFSTVWVSQAAAKQRAGRAGRTRPGICWRLCSENFFEKELPKHTLCEMQRTALEELVLQLRLLDLGDHPGDFLRLAPEPPALEAVERAIRSLVAIGALESSSKLGLTPLGFHLAHMPVDARIGKMLVYGSLCQCLAPILTIAACLSQKSPFVRSFNRTKEELQVTERQGAWGYLSSDQLAIVKAFDKYQEQKSVSRDAAWEVCDRFGLSASTLDDMAQLRRQFLRHLTETGFALEETEDGGEQVNIHKKNMSLVRCVLCAGLFPSVAQVQKQSNSRGISYQIFVSRQNERCTPHPSSLNFKAQDFAANHGWLLFHDKVKTTQIYLHDTTLIGAIPLLLFGGELKISRKERKCVTVDGMTFEAKDEKSAVLFKELRRELDRLLLLKVANPSEDLASSAEPLLLTVSKLLQWEERGASGKRQ